MSDWKIKVTFADGSKRVLKDPSELAKANKRKLIRFVFASGKTIEGYLSQVHEDGNITLRGEKLIPTVLIGSKIVGWCYKHTAKTSATRAELLEKELKNQK